MHFRLIQTTANFKSSYTVVADDGTQVYSAEIPRNMLLSKISFFKNNSLLYYLSFDLAENIRNIPKFGTDYKGAPFAIKNNYDEIVGALFSQKTKYFGGYSYYVYNINGRSYNIYVIGKGKEGMKVALYEEQRQIALIEKGTVVYDNKDEYDIYAIDPYYMEITSIFCLYYDFIRHGNQGKVVYKTKQMNYIYTFHKELNSKYDPLFKTQC